MVYTICLSQQCDQGLHCLPFSAFWYRSTTFAILSLIRVCTICHSQYDQGLINVYTVWKFSAVWSVSTLSAILSSLIRVHTISHSQQSDQGLHCLPFSAFWSGSTLFAIHSSLNTDYTVCHSQQSNQGLRYLPFSVWSGPTPFAILSILIKVCTVILSSLINVKVHWHSQEKFDQGLHCLPFSAVWSGSIVFAILSSVIRLYTVCHSQQSYQGLHYFPFSVWSCSTLFAILSSLIRVYTFCHSKSDQGLHCHSHSLIKVYTTWHSRQSDHIQSLHCHSQEQPDLGLHYMPFSAVWSGSTLFAILSILI